MTLRTTRSHVAFIVLAVLALLGGLSSAASAVTATFQIDKCSGGAASGYSVKVYKTDGNCSATPCQIGLGVTNANGTVTISLDGHPTDIDEVTVKIQKPNATPTDQPGIISGRMIHYANGSSGLVNPATWGADKFCSVQNNYIQVKF